MILYLLSLGRNWRMIWHYHFSRDCFDTSCMISQFRTRVETDVEEEAWRQRNVGEGEIARHKSTLLIMNLALLQAQPSSTARSRSEYKCKSCNCVFTRFTTFQDITLSHRHSKCELTALQHNGIGRDVNTRDKEMNECIVASCSYMHQYLSLFKSLGSP